MAIASLILSILGLLIAMTIFKDLSLILSVLAIVLGGVALAKKKGKVMCIISIVIAVLGLILVFSEPSNNTTVTSNGDSSTSSENNSSQESNKTYGLNKEITIKNSSGEYTLVITGIKEMSERNEFSDKNFSQVFLIDYTYKNISYSDSLYVSDMNFKIIDEQGEIGDSYPNDYTSPQSITEGITCKASMCLGVNNQSNTIKLQYFSNMFNSKPDAVFELNVNN